MLASHHTARTVRRASVPVVAVLALLALLTTGAFDLSSARASDDTADRAAVATAQADPQTVSKLVRVERPWVESCSGDVCGSNVGILPMSLPPSWVGQNLRITATLTFNHRMKGVDRLVVGARVASNDLSTSNVKALAPKRWTVLRAGKGYDSTTVQFTKRMTVPKNAQIYFNAGPRKDPRGRDYEIRGTKALWSVTATR
jgi:hypothetical protein